MLPVLWLVISVLMSFTPWAFRNSPDFCRGVTFQGWLEFELVSNLIGVFEAMGKRDLGEDREKRVFLGITALILSWIWAVYLVRHRYDIWNEIQVRQERQKSFLRKILFAIMNLISACWWAPMSLFLE
jgi:hypothetical protein